MVFDGLPEQSVLLPYSAKTMNVIDWVDTVGQAIEAMETGKSFQALGREPEQVTVKTNLKPVAKDDYLEGRIIYIDNFENVIVNITRSLFDSVCRGRKFRINFKGDESITRISNGYGDVPEGSKLAFFNTAGYLEIAVNKGNAAGLFGLQQFNSNLSTAISQSRIFYQTVKVYFE